MHRATRSSSGMAASSEARRFGTPVAYGAAVAETRTMPQLGGVHSLIRTGVRRRRPRRKGPNPWDEIDRAINASFFVPRLRPDVEIRDFTRRSGERYTMIASPAPTYMRLTE